MILHRGVIMRRAIWLPAGEIVVVRSYDEYNNIVIIEHGDGRYDTVAVSTIHFLEYPVYLKAAADSGG
jgi:hypothetical protein